MAEMLDDDAWWRLVVGVDAWRWVGAQVRPTSCTMHPTPPTMLTLDGGVQVRTRANVDDTLSLILPGGDCRDPRDNPRDQVLPAL